MFSVKNHFLFKDGVNVPYRPSPNKGGIITPTLIVVHYTGSNSLQGALSWLCTPGSKVSAHLVVDKDGAIYQLLPFNRAGWHAGVSEYEGRGNVNQFSVGIENVGLGLSWPEAQVLANRAIFSAICDAYKIEDIVGHEDVAMPPGRKPDPGPKYPWAMVTTEKGD